MKKLTFILVAISLLSDCKKDNTTSTVNGKVKLVTYSSGDSETYSYDSYGRLIEIKYSDGRMDVFNYSATSFTRYFYLLDSIPNGSITYPLNAKGLEIDNGKIYDSDGYLVSENDGLGGTIFYYYSSGNLVTEAIGSPGNVFYYTYTYLTDKIDYRDIGITYKGKQNKNLISAVNEAPKIRTYSYEYDLQGRVVKETNILDGGTPNVTTYTYY